MKDGVPFFLITYVQYDVPSAKLINAETYLVSNYCLKKLHGPVPVPILQCKLKINMEATFNLDSR